MNKENKNIKHKYINVNEKDEKYYCIVISQIFLFIAKIVKNIYVQIAIIHIKQNDILYVFMLMKKLKKEKEKTDKEFEKQKIDLGKFIKKVD